MLRLGSVLAAVLVLAAPSASADETYVDRINGFRVIVPSGWEKLVGEKPESLDLALISPRFDTSEALCGIGSEATDETRSASQAQINEAFASEINAAFWASIVADDNVSDIVIDVARSEIKNGRRVFFATAHYTEKTEEGEVRAQSNFVLHLIPGQMLLAQCQVQLVHAAAEKADFKTILESTEPLGNLVAGRHPPPTRQTTALVLYAGPSFRRSATGPNT